MQKIKLTWLHKNSVASIILDDGKGNVIDRLMMEELQEILNGFLLNQDLKLITLEGAGKHFSFGASVEDHRKDYAAEMLRAFHGLFYTLADLSVPMLAKISGQCLGGGLELALMCNILFAEKGSRLGQPEIVLGVFPPPASILLPEKIGLARAEELLITGKTISADEANKMGLINEVFEDKNALDAATEWWIEQYILPKSASSLRYAVKASRAKFNRLLGDFLPVLEHMYVHELMETHDANEGVNSFLEKRSPVWENN